jgi:hypothetical protein
MPNAPDSDQKKSGLLGQIIAGVVIALIAGGTLPWWYNVFFSKATVKSEPVSIEVSRDFMVGRWQFREATDSSGEIDFSANGRFDTAIANSSGGTDHANGTWDFEKLSHRSFILRLAFTSFRSRDIVQDSSNVPPEQVNFEVFDQNHIHSIDDKYVADRLR